ncbi:MAG: ATP-binding protein [Chloroflexota bacterium]
MARILVVFDDKAMREGCRRVLSAEGLEVETADSGQKGLEILRRGSFDLVLLDFKTPGTSGIEMLDSIAKIDPSLVTIIVPGYTTLDLAIEATKMGGYDILPKPFSPEELLTKVAIGLARRSLLVEARRLRESKAARLLEIATEQSRLRTIINCIVDGVLVTNQEGQVVLHNPAALRMLGCGDAPLQGRHVTECLISKELGSLILDALSPANAGYTMLSRELTVGDEDSIVLMANIAPVRDEHGTVSGSVAVLRDISKLKELDRVKSQFVSTVSHELRSPLGVVHGYLEIVLEDPNIPKEAAEMLRRAKERTKGLLGLIEDLLDMSTIEAGRVARNVEALNIAEVIHSAVEFMQTTAQERQLTLGEQIAGELPAVEADRDDMTRVLTNLLSNAIKYNRPGGQVTVQASVSGPFVRIDVIDTGIGIPPEAIPRVFDEFFRVKRPETRGITGTGLGLSIVKRIIEAHHGRVELHSELDKGTTVSVYLPFTKD